jgi:hypothetical protein
MLCEDGCLVIFQDGVLSTARKDIESNCKINNVELLQSETTVAETDSGTDEKVETGMKEQEKKKKKEKEDEGNRMSIDVEGTFRSTYTDDESFVTNPTGDTASPENTATKDSTHQTPSPSKLRDLSLTVDIPLHNTPITLENGGENPLSDPISPQWSSHFRVGISHAMTPISFVLGTWNVRIESQEVAVETLEGKIGKKGRGLEHVRTLQSVRTLLDGNFHYHLLVPVHCTHLTVPALIMESGSSSHGSSKADSEVSLFVLFSHRLTRYLTAHILYMSP